MRAHDPPRRKSKAVGSGFELNICAFDKAWNDGGLEDIIKTDHRRKNIPQAYILRINHYLILASLLHLCGHY